MQDDTVYICEAHNHFGKIQAEARITVTGLGECKLSLMFFMLYTVSTSQIQKSIDTQIAVFKGQTFHKDCNFSISGS